MDDAVAVSLPIEDRAATFSDYAESVLANGITEEDFVVGHSMGGITASIVASRTGAQVGYVAALLPRSGSTLAALFDQMLCPGLGLERRDGLDHFDPDDARARGLDPTVMRGQALAPYFEALGEPTPGRYIGCRHDRVVRPEYQATVADVFLDCGHDAHRELPAELAELLVDVA